MSDDEPTRQRNYLLFCGKCRQEFMVPRDEIPDDGRIWYCANCSKPEEENAP